MKHLLLPLIIFAFSFSVNAQNESISLVKSDGWVAKGNIVSINAKQISFIPLESQDNQIIFKNQNGKSTTYKSKKLKNGHFIIDRNQISINKSSNNFKTYLINSGSNFSLLEDRVNYTQYNLSKFRKLQLTARWMSIFGAVVSTVGALSAVNNTSADSNPAVFAIGGAALSGLGFIIDLASFSKLKFEKNYKSYDEKTKTYTFE